MAKIVLSRGKGAGACLHLVSRLGMTGCIPLHLLYKFMAWPSMNLSFHRLLFNPWLHILSQFPSCSFFLSKFLVFCSVCRCAPRFFPVSTFPAAICFTLHSIYIATESFSSDQDGTGLRNFQLQSRNQTGDGPRNFCLRTQNLL